MHASLLLRGQVYISAALALAGAMKYASLTNQLVVTFANAIVRTAHSPMIWTQ
jgi:hypothetical protein